MIVDIGSNDGNSSPILKNLQNFGVTPENMAKIALNRGIPNYPRLFFWKIITIYKKIWESENYYSYKCICTHGRRTFILKSIKKLMKKDGIFISESHYLYDLIQYNQYDTIYHEHLRYYSLSSLKYLFNKAD